MHTKNTTKRSGEKEFKEIIQFMLPYVDSGILWPEMSSVHLSFVLSLSIRLAVAITISRPLRKELFPRTCIEGYFEGRNSVAAPLSSLIQTD